MNVLQLSRWLVDSGGGGIQTYLRTLPIVLDPIEVNLEYAALLPGVRPGYAKLPPRLGIEGIPKWRNALLLYRWLHSKLTQVDVVHIHGVTDWHFVVGALVCRSRNTPYVVRPTGGLFPEVLTETFRRRLISLIFMKLCGRRLLVSAHTVIASSARESNLLQTIDKRISVRVIPHGVPVPEVVPVKARAGGGLRLVFIGRIEPVKSLPTLLNALARLKNEGLYVMLDIVGSGDSRYVAGLQKRILDLNIENSVILHGDQRGQRKQSLLTEADLLVLPSLSENFGFVVAEAMAIGTPVVVSDGVGVADQVLRYRAGTVFPVGDDEALANALRSFLDPEEVRVCGKRAYDCAKREFSMESMGREILDVYRQAVSSSQKLKRADESA